MKGAPCPKYAQMQPLRHPLQWHGQSRPSPRHPLHRQRTILAQWSTAMQRLPLRTHPAVRRMCYRPPRFQTQPTKNLVYGRRDRATTTRAPPINPDLRKTPVRPPRSRIPPPRRPRVPPPPRRSRASNPSRRHPTKPQAAIRHLQTAARLPTQVRNRRPSRPVSSLHHLSLLFSSRSRSLRPMLLQLRKMVLVSLRPMVRRRPQWRPRNLPPVRKAQPSHPRLQARLELRTPAVSGCRRPGPEPH